jgi:tRNA (guanosine-2'-O-)-methyltransferase
MTAAVRTGAKTRRGQLALGAGVLALGLLSGAGCEPRPEARPGPYPPASRASDVSRLASDTAEGLETSSLRPLEPCMPVSYETCGNALDDNCNGALEEGCGAPGGVVQFMIAWDAALADVDLNVTDPNGELIEAGRVVKSGLLKGRDCPGRRQECAGVNVENVFLEGNKPPTRGTYRVSVALESLAGAEPPIWVNLSSRLGTKRYAFEIRLIEPEDSEHVDLTL